jgi:hypothetical protein
VTDAVIGFVLDQDQFVGLDDHARLGLLMELQKAHRHALRIRIVARIRGGAFVAERLGPRCVGLAAFDVLSGLKEGRARRGVGIEGDRCLLRLERHTASAAATAFAAIAFFTAAAITAAAATTPATPTVSRRRGTSRRYTSSDNVPPSTSVGFSLQLAGLGEDGEREWPPRVCTPQGT